MPIGAEPQVGQSETSFPFARLSVSLVFTSSDAVGCVLGPVEVLSAQWSSLCEWLGYVGDGPRQAVCWVPARRR